MYQQKKNLAYESGFIKIILMAIIVIATLSYFNIDLHTFFQNPIIQKIGNILVTAWASFIKPLLVYLYTSVSGLFAR